MLKSFLSLWLKFPCPLCKRIAENTICEYCRKKLLSYRFSNPKKNWTGNHPIFAWGKYDGELSKAIARLKYDNNPEIGIILGNWLGESWLQSRLIIPSQKLTVVPIPLSQNKLKARGFNQAELIARGFCQVTKYNLQKKGLLRVKDTLAMFNLSPTQRQQNIKNAFQVSEVWQQNPPQTPILLIDDIYTRGTTVKEATKVLHKHNAKVLGAIAVAKAI